MGELRICFLGRLSTRLIVRLYFEMIVFRSLSLCGAPIGGVWRQRTVLSRSRFYAHLWSMALLRFYAGFLALARFFVRNHRQVGLKPWSYCMCYNPWIHKVITMLSGLVELPEFPSWSSLIYCQGFVCFKTSCFLGNIFSIFWCFGTIKNHGQTKNQFL